MHTEATGHSCLMWFNKITCDWRYLQSPYPPLTVPPLPPPTSLSFTPLPLSPPAHPNSATYPPQTHSNTCTVVRKGYIYMYICGSPGWYFNRLIMFEMLKQKGQVYMHYVDLSGVHASTLCMSLALNRSSALQHFDCNDTIKMCNGNDRWDCQMK